MEAAQDCLLWHSIGEPIPRLPSSGLLQVNDKDGSLAVGPSDDKL